MWNCGIVFCGIVVPSQNNNILLFNQYMKLHKMPYINHADVSLLIKKIDGCANNPGKSSITKIREHIPYGYLMSNIWAFDIIENKDTLYRGEDFMKKFCTSLREHASNIINFENKKMLPSTKKS